MGGNRVAFALRWIRALQEELASLGIPLRILAPADSRRGAGRAAHPGPGGWRRRPPGSSTSTR
ncbi:MAG: hypothetical protein U5R48_15160 [Gammaproteobacteria bacterium]|nr:hypothetical protein [Gammaproteobacteria bacterium]